MPIIEEKKLIKKIYEFKGNYKFLKNYINFLRKSNNNILIINVITNVINKNQNYKRCLKSILNAEKFVLAIKENKFNSIKFKKLLLKNLNLIKIDKILLENLKDLFEYDTSLNILQNEFNNFLKNYIENTTLNALKDSEKQIIYSSNSDINRKIENAEETIALSLDQILLKIYNSINVIEAKNNFVKYIEKYESLNISIDHIKFLVQISKEFHTINTPKMWNEIKYKLTYTNKIEHFKAWQYGFQQGRYKSIILNIKEYIVKEIIKIILQEISNQFIIIQSKCVQIINFLDTDNLSIDQLKIEYKNFIKDHEVKKIKNTDLVIQLEAFINYFSFLYYNIESIKEITRQTLQRLSICNNAQEKLDFLFNSKNSYKYFINNDELKFEIGSFFKNLIILFSAIKKNEKQQEDLNTNNNLQEQQIVNDDANYIDPWTEESIQSNLENYNNFNTKKIGIPKPIELALINLKGFKRPHSFILDVIRKSSDLQEINFDTNKRREIIDQLFKENKIFTYDGNSYIGKGQIYNLVKLDKIPKEHRSIFVIRLDDFLEKFKTNEEKFNFLGVKDEVEYSALNIILDKYNLNRNNYNDSNLIVNKDYIPNPAKLKKLAALKKKKQNIDMIIDNTCESPEKDHDLIIDVKIKNDKTKFKKIKEKKYEISINELNKKRDQFITKHQEAILKEVSKEINKNFEKLIKNSKSKHDLDVNIKNYLGNTDFHKKNLLNLCYNMKQLAKIIYEDKTLFAKISFNKKIQKIIDNKKKKMKY